MSLARLLNDELPLNRKERYFTGTVFPMIVCRDNFKYFGEFLKLIGVTDYPALIGDPQTTNIEFFTEYSQVESDCGGKFKNIPERKDTPKK